eukprot:790584-Rhodomonas_salina.1
MATSHRSREREEEKSARRKEGRERSVTRVDALSEGGRANSAAEQRRERHQRRQGEKEEGRESASRDERGRKERITAREEGKAQRIATVRRLRRGRS